MEASIKLYFDDENGDLVAQKYILDGEEVSSADFLDVCDGVIEILSEDSDELECDGNCEECELNDEFIDECTIDEMIEDYTEIILDTDGCANCTHKALKNFFEEIIDMFGIEEVEDYE